MPNARAGESSRWRLHVIGEPRLVGPNGPLRLERRTLAVLTYLALEGQAVKYRLAGWLWPDSSETAARANMRQLLRRLRVSAGEELVRGGDTIALDPDVGSDATDVRRLAREERWSDVLEEAGELLGGLEFDDLPDFAEWLLGERERLLQTCRDAARAGAAACERDGRFDDALVFAARQLDLEPLSEEGHRTLMRLHYLAGDRGAALAAYARCQSVLREALGVDPLPETRALAAEIERGGTLNDAPPPARTLPLAVLRPPVLVGRRDVLDRMHDAWEAGRGVVLLGEPGVGKTRLVQEFLEARGGGMRFEGRLGDGLTRYATHARTYRQVLTAFPNLDLPAWVRAELARLVPDLGPAPEPIRSESEKLRFWQAKAEVLRLATEAGLRHLVFDDCQFMDDASVEAGHFVFESLSWGQPSAPYRTIHVFRTGALSETFEARLKGAIAAGHVERIDLEPLGSDAVGELVRHLGLRGGPDLGERLTRFTGGNPLFVLETARHLHEQRLADDVQGASFPLTPKVGAVIGERLSRLSPSALHAARACAILESEFTLELVADALGAPLLPLVDAWAELEGAQIVQGDRFSHDLVREAVVSGMPDAVRGLLHRACAKTLARHGAPPSRVARHWLDGGDARQAAPWQLRAAHEALSAYRHAEAAAFYEDAARSFEASNDFARAFEALLERAKLFKGLEVGEERARVVAWLMRLARTPRHKAQGLQLRGWTEYLEGRATEAEATARQGLALASRLHDVTLQAALANIVGVSLWAQGRLPEAAAAYEEAVALGERLGASEELADSLANLGKVLEVLGRPRDALAPNRRAAEVYEALPGVHDNHVVALDNLALNLMLLGETRSARGPLEQARVMLDQAADVTLDHVNTAAYQAMACVDLAEFTDALAHLEQAEAWRVQCGATGRVLLRVLNARAWTLLGEFERAEGFLSDVLATPTLTAERRGTTLAALGALLAWQGRDAAPVLADAERVLADASPLARAELDLVRAAVTEPDEAARFASAALDVAVSHGCPGLEIVARARLAAALLHVKAADAPEHAARAAHLCERFDPGRGFYKAEVLAVHARALSHVGHPLAASVLADAASWVERVARLHVPAPHRESFLRRNPVNRALLDAAHPASRSA